MSLHWVCSLFHEWFPAERWILFIYLFNDFSDGEEGEGDLWSWCFTVNTQSGRYGRQALPALPRSRVSALLKDSISPEWTQESKRTHTVFPSLHPIFNDWPLHFHPVPSDFLRFISSWSLTTLVLFLCISLAELGLDSVEIAPTLFCLRFKLQLTLLGVIQHTDCRFFFSSVDYM